MLQRPYCQFFFEASIPNFIILNITGISWIWLISIRALIHIMGLWALVVMTTQFDKVTKMKSYIIKNLIKISVQCVPIHNSWTDNCYNKTFLIQHFFFVFILKLLIKIVHSLQQFKPLSLLNLINCIKVSYLWQSV